MTRASTGTLRILFALAALAGSLTLVEQGPAQQPSSADAQALDQAIAWMAEAKRNYQAVVRDYTCIFVSRENIKGRMNEDHFIQLKFRSQPYSAYMKWLGPKRLAGQELAFVQGKNNNKLRVHSKGVLGVAGFVTIDVEDPRVREHSRHSIYEAGLGNLIDMTIRSYDQDKKMGRTQTRIAEYDFDNRHCYRIESVRAERLPNSYAYRSVIYLEKNSKYPLRNENYHWPVAGGSAGGELMESFSYTNLQFNVGLKDQDFDK
jgi:hypothetical protein